MVSLNLLILVCACVRACVNVRLMSRTNGNCTYAHKNNTQKSMCLIRGNENSKKKLKNVMCK